VPATVVVGTQWGDEGKGKLTTSCLVTWTWRCATRVATTPDTESSSMTKRSRSSSCPSGVLYPRSRRSSATASWWTPPSCSPKLDTLSAKNVDVSRLIVSGNAHLIMPYHQGVRPPDRTLPRQERARHHEARIGPAYADKSSRVGLRCRTCWTRRSFAKSSTSSCKRRI